MSYLGEFPGLQVGAAFKNRSDLRLAQVHRQLQRGISWAPDSPAESIVLSGGYEDDEDWGDTILYTGMGGKSGKHHVAHQELTMGNLALMRSLELHTPVRVIRAAAAQTPYSPKHGLRYDGLFMVTDAYTDQGRSGYRVWRFVLQRIDTMRPTQETTKAQRAIMSMYFGSCQVCSRTTKLQAGPVSVATYIMPRSRPHNGPDEGDNLLSLCPNHSAEFVSGTLRIEQDLTVAHTGHALKVMRGHSINVEYLKYRISRYSWSAG